MTIRYHPGDFCFCDDAIMKIERKVKRYNEPRYAKWSGSSVEVHGELRYFATWGLWYSENLKSYDNRVRDLTINDFQKVAKSIINPQGEAAQSKELIKEALLWFLKTNGAPQNLT